MSWSGGVRYSCLLQSLVVSLLSPLVSTIFFFSDWRRTVSSKFFVTQLPSLSTKEFVLLLCIRCVLSSSLQRTQPSIKLLSPQLAESRILHAMPAIILPRTHLSSHSALSSYGLFAPLALWRLFVSLRPLVQALEKCPASGAPSSFA